VVVSTLTARLRSTAPSSFKAVLLLQAVPCSSTIPLIEHLGLLAKADTNPYIANIASALLEAAEAEKAKQSEAAAQYKWTLWAGHYGQSRVGWLPLPKPEEPDWDWYGLRWVDRDEWWTIQPTTDV
jgi:hypothetical protein